MCSRGGTHSSNRAAWLIASVGFWALPRLTLATDVFFPDREVRSPSKQWRLTAKSPDNEQKLQNGRPVPFAQNFTYTLHDDRAGTVVWSRGQPESEYSPMKVFLDDQGWVVIWTGWQQLVVLDRADGKAKLTVKILDQFPDGERQRYVHDTTAGPMWDKRSLWHFVEHEGRTLFVVRAWWDRRIVVDLAAGKLLSDEGKLHDALEAADREWALRMLEAARAAGPPASLECCDLPETFWDTVTAAHVAGRARIREATPALRSLEKWDFVGSGGGGLYGVHLKVGEIDPACCDNYTLRQIVQLALRRLGEKPTGLAATRFHHVKKGTRLGNFVDVKSPMPERTEGVERIRNDMTPADVLGMLGAPDFVGRRNPTDPGCTEVWEYDLDSSPAFTLRIIWDQKRVRVESIERLTPALWQTDTRDEDIID